MSMRFRAAKPLVLVAASILVAQLSGCAVQPCCTSVQAGSPVCIGPTCAPRTVVASPTKLMAVGYGSTGGYAQYTPPQQRLMAMRAAQVDAYRNLAEQVNGFRIWGNTAVSAFATQNDSIRSYVDSFIRGARVVSITAIADGNFEATVELDVSPQFIDCFASQQGACGFRAAYPVLPSGTYVSN